MNLHERSDWDTVSPQQVINHGGAKLLKTFNDSISDGIDWFFQEKKKDSKEYHR